MGYNSSDKSQPDVQTVLAFLSKDRKCTRLECPYKVGTRRWFTFRYIEDCLKGYEYAIDRLKPAVNLDDTGMFRNSLAYYKHAAGAARHMIHHLQAVTDQSPVTGRRKKRKE